VRAGTLVWRLRCATPVRCYRVTFLPVNLIIRRYRHVASQQHTQDTNSGGDAEGRSFHMAGSVYSLTPESPPPVATCACPPAPGPSALRCGRTKARSASPTVSGCSGNA